MSADTNHDLEAPYAAPAERPVPPSELEDTEEREQEARVVSLGFATGRPLETEAARLPAFPAFLSMQADSVAAGREAPEDRDEVLRRWMKSVLDGKNRFSPALLLSPEVAATCRHLPEYERVVREAAEKSQPEHIVRFMETLYEVLPTSFAESFVQEAAKVVLRTSPLAIIEKHEAIRKHLPEAGWMITTAVDRYGRHSTPHAIMNFPKIADALGEESAVATAAEDLLKLDPNFAISAFETPKGNERFIAALRTRHAPETVVLERIAALEGVPADEKEDAATLLDQCIFEPNLTPEEAVAIAQDRDRFLKLVQEISEKPNHLGEVSVARKLLNPSAVIRPEDNVVRPPEFQ